MAKIIPKRAQSQAKKAKRATNKAKNMRLGKVKRSAHRTKSVAKMQTDTWTLLDARARFWGVL